MAKEEVRNEEKKKEERRIVMSCRTGRMLVLKGSRVVELTDDGKPLDLGDWLNERLRVLLSHEGHTRLEGVTVIMDSERPSFIGAAVIGVQVVLPEFPWKREQEDAAEGS